MARLHLFGCIVDVQSGYVEHRDGRRETLTTMERHLLSYLSDRPDTDISHEQLLSEVWEYAPGVNTRAAYFTARRLRSKIEADPKIPRHLLTAHGVGYRFVHLAEPAIERQPTPAFLVPVHTNLCPDATTFLGRQDPLNELRNRMTGDGRLVTLTGPGGTGKTRLASELGSRLHRRGYDVWFCDLAEVSTLAGLARIVARVLSVPLGGELGAEVERIGTALEGREKVVVILDNFEQIVDLASKSVAVWMRSAPEIRFLVTSRTPLRIKGEQVLFLDSLETEDAVALLADRVQAAGRELPSGVAPILRKIAAELDGMPLALELAAARLAVLSPEQVLARLSDRFRLLNRAERGGQPRHQTLRAAIDWSWDLLTAHEQSALAQCSAFRGGFGLEDAQAVIQLPDDAPWVMDVVQTLAERSLLKVGPVPEIPGELRFSLYVTIQDYAWNKLQSSPDCDAVSHRHAVRMVDEGSRLTRAHEEGKPGALVRLALQAQNLDAALTRATDPELICRLALALFPVLESGAPLESRLMVLDRAVSVCEQVEVPLRADVYRTRGGALRGTVRADQAEADLKRAVALAESCDDPLLKARTLLTYGRFFLVRGRLDDAGTWLNPARELVRDTDPYAEHEVLQALLHRWLDSGGFDEATAVAEEILTLRRTRGLTHLPMSNLTVWLHHTERTEEERAALKHDLGVFRSMGQRHLEALTLMNLAVDMAAHGDRGAAPSLIEVAKLCSELGHGYYESLTRYNLGTVHLDRGDFNLAREQFEHSLALGERIGHLRTQSLAYLGAGVLALSEGRDPAPSGRKAIATATAGGDEFLLRVTEVMTALDGPDEEIFARSLAFAERFGKEQVEVWTLCWRGVAHLPTDAEPAREAIRRARHGSEPWIGKDLAIRIMVRVLESRLG